MDNHETPWWKRHLPWRSHQFTSQLNAEAGQVSQNPLNLHAPTETNRLFEAPYSQFSSVLVDWKSDVDAGAELCFYSPRVRLTLRDSEAPDIALFVGKDVDTDEPVELDSEDDATIRRVADEMGIPIEENWEECNT